MVRIEGVADECAELLEADVVDTVDELRNQYAENLAAHLVPVNADKKLTRSVPASLVVSKWIDQAQTPVPVIRHSPNHRKEDVMKEWTDRLAEFLGPTGSGALVHALIGLAILVVGLVVVKLTADLLKKVLDKVPAPRCERDDGTVGDLASPIVSLVKAVLTILVLIAVLEHFGLTNVLDPLKSMASRFADAVPNIIGAGVIAYAGWIIAKVLAQLAEAALEKIDQRLAERMGNAKIHVAKFGSALVFAVVLLPIIVSALGVLDIPAISEPASAMIEELMAAVVIPQSQVRISNPSVPGSNLGNLVVQRPMGRHDPSALRACRQHLLGDTSVHRPPLPVAPRRCL